MPFVQKMVEHCHVSDYLNYMLRCFYFFVILYSILVTFITLNLRTRTIMFIPIFHSMRKTLRISTETLSKSETTVKSFQ